MSAPNTGRSDPVSGVSMELMSGMSSLHMPAEPRPHEEEDLFLSDTDENVHHALEHLRAAAGYVNQLYTMQRDLDALARVARILYSHVREAGLLEDRELRKFVLATLRHARSHVRAL